MLLLPHTVDPMHSATFPHAATCPHHNLCLLPTLLPTLNPTTPPPPPLCREPSSFRGVQGTAVVGLFGMTLASTGASEKALVRAGLPFKRVYAHINNHAGYYPGATTIDIKLLFDPKVRCMWSVCMWWSLAGCGYAVHAHNDHGAGSQGLLGPSVAARWPAAAAAADDDGCRC